MCFPLLCAQGVKVTLPGQKLSAPTTIDTGTLRLRETKSALKEQRNRLQQEIEKAQRKVLEALRLKQKDIAALHLKRRKALDAMLIKRVASLDTVSQILLQLDVADTNAQLLSAYRLGKDMLAEKAKRSGLTAEAVGDTLDGLREVFADQAEVDAAIGGTCAAPYVTFFFVAFRFQFVLYISVL